MLHTLHTLHYTPILSVNANAIATTASILAIQDNCSRYLTFRALHSTVLDDQAIQLTDASRVAE